MSTLDRITELAARQFGGDARTIDTDAPIQQLGADSLGYLEFLFELEEHFDVTIEQDAAKQVRTLRDLGALVDRVVAAKLHPIG